MERERERERERGRERGTVRVSIGNRMNASAICDLWPRSKRPGEMAEMGMKETHFDYICSIHMVARAVLAENAQNRPFCRILVFDIFTEIDLNDTFHFQKVSRGKVDSRQSWNNTRKREPETRSTDLIQIERNN